ncbi:MAG TPA: winged helix-turn-helix domain-containing protein [Candidatus Bathyarchaeia archaeon]
MRRSKLEMYIDILNALAHKGPLKLTHIMYKANVNCSLLKESLEFLIKQGLVEKRTIKKERMVFAVTQRGINVLKYFRELTLALPFIEDPNDKRRYCYTKPSNTIPGQIRSPENLLFT